MVGDHRAAPATRSRREPWSFSRLGRGLDALVFTGGVGEHAPVVRARTARGLAHLGVSLDETVNAALHGEGDISAPGSRVPVVVVEAREDLEMERQVRGLLRADRAGGHDVPEGS